ncbi:hypothetical protein COX00_04855 [Candidatus Uhrbacteria bacterium CG22_combo_CG10-13_8_21_14_all_47_17]|uniref:Uncharacterized protein n=1 Tax=Candidatus Uhrbacteria bacterium CG22_combo_CG10-13_8_21_14_all_47_17 TaxID=1975041 RepID=A0A2H0BSW8_9BACT|nr:MAG: hypothetical protein COX00_04855 [Candidatus Uhrbacteria bacterium CG22_combo_CG10-13_8_21_14_all_47_17]
MIPLSYLLIAWAILIGIFFLYSLITVGVYLKFGVAGSFTSATAALFLGVIFGALFLIISYFGTVDWSKPLPFIDLNLIPNASSQLQL